MEGEEEEEEEVTEQQLCLVTRWSVIAFKSSGFCCVTVCVLLYLRLHLQGWRGGRGDYREGEVRYTEGRGVKKRVKGVWR